MHNKYQSRSRGNDVTGNGQGDLLRNTFRRKVDGKLLIDVGNLRPLDEREIGSGIGLPRNRFAKNRAVHGEHQIGDKLDPALAMSSADEQVPSFSKNSTVMSVILSDDGAVEKDRVDRSGGGWIDIQLVVPTL